MQIVDLCHGEYIAPHGLISSQLLILHNSKCT